MSVPGAEFFIGVAVLVVGGLLLAASRRIGRYIIDALAAALVRSINGQLGLDGIREDVSVVKKQVGDVAAMEQKIANLEGQIAALHGD